MKIAIILDLFMLWILWPVGIICIIETYLIADYQKNKKINKPVLIIYICLFIMFSAFAIRPSIIIFVILNYKEITQKINDYFLKEKDSKEA